MSNQDLNHNLGKRTIQHQLYLKVSQPSFH